MRIQARVRLNQSTRRRQRGVVMAVLALALLAILGLAGMATDWGHATLNKTRIQNSLDAAALAGAKAFSDAYGDGAGNVALAKTAATTAAQTVFQNNLDASGNSELAGLTTVVEFSAVMPFVPGGDGPFVRVNLSSQLSLETAFSRVFGVNNMDVNTSAVAGPSPVFNNACDITPMLACGETDPEEEGSFWGYEIGDVTTVKLSAGKKADGGTDPGNFQLLALDGNTGGSDVRIALAGGYTGCAGVGNTETTEPGDKVGPVQQGINTRFGIYQGPVDPTLYPPDKVITQNIDYDAYRARYGAKSYDEPDGVANRRVLTIPVGDCSETVRGRGEVPILGLGCFFLQTPVDGNMNVTGEFVGSCDAEGNPGPDWNQTIGPKTIQLYGDTSRWDS